MMRSVCADVPSCPCHHQQQVQQQRQLQSIKLYEHHQQQHYLLCHTPAGVLNPEELAQAFSSHGVPITAKQVGLTAWGLSGCTAEIEPCSASHMASTDGHSVGHSCVI